MRWVSAGREHTTILELPFKQLDHSLRMAFVLFIALDHLAELRNPLVEWVKVAHVVHPRFVHVIQNLLHDMSQVSASGPYYQVRRGYEERERGPFGGGPTHPHGCDLGISRWTFIGLPDGHEKQRKQVEYIRHRCIQPVVVRLLVISDFVQLCDCAIPIGG